MARLQSYGLCRAASVLAVLPCHIAWLFGMPAGICAWTVLSRPDVQAAFHGKTHRTRPRSFALNILLLIVVGLLIGPLSLVIAYLWMSAPSATRPRADSQSAGSPAAGDPNAIPRVGAWSDRPLLDRHVRSISASSEIRTIRESQQNPSRRLRGIRGARSAEHRAAHRRLRPPRHHDPALRRPGREARKPSLVRARCDPGQAAAIDRSPEPRARSPGGTRGNLPGRALWARLLRLGQGRRSARALARRHVVSLENPVAKRTGAIRKRSSASQRVSTLLEGSGKGARHLSPVTGTLPAPSVVKGVRNQFGLRANPKPPTAYCHFSAQARTGSSGTHNQE